MPDTWEIQAARRRAEPEPRDWPTMRDAILAAKGAREGVIEENQVRYVLGVDPAGKDPGCTVAIAIPDDPNAPRTLIDELYDEKHGL